ncbi:MAG: hypothetical protein Q4F31_01780 [Eubacteriales bacterium]|nr:hypothetical protein [Eubacteriales bacterium]
MFSLHSMFVFLYLDPSVITYTIQVVGGIVIAIGTFIGLYWHKAKKNVKRKLGIDDDSKKEIEEDIVEIEDEGSAK